MIAALLCLSLLGGLPRPAQAQSAAEYRAIVAGALAIAERASGPEVPAAGRAEALADIRRALDGVLTLHFGAGEPMIVANPPLRAALASGDLERVRADLAALLAALEAAEATSPPPADARARLAAVLARPEFRGHEPGPLDRLLQPLREQGERLWRTVVFRLLRGGAEPAALVFVAAGVLVVLGLGALLAGAFGGTVVASARAVVHREPARPSARATRARADALAQAGEYRAAVRELYLATLLHLDERGLLRFRPSLTNREHLAPSRATPDVAAVLEPLVERYDEWWYGGLPCGADEWQRFASLAEAAWTRRAPVAVAQNGEGAAR